MSDQANLSLNKELLKDLDERRLKAYENIEYAFMRDMRTEKTLSTNIPEGSYWTLMEIVVEGLKLITDEELIDYFNFGKTYSYRFDYILEQLFSWRIDRIPSAEYKSGIQKYGVAYVPLLLLARKSGLESLSIDSIFAIFGKA